MKSHMKQFAILGSILAASYAAYGALRLIQLTYEHGVMRCLTIADRLRNGL